jgi:uncharacterized protein (TIGR03437 family)
MKHILCAMSLVAICSASVYASSTVYAGADYGLFKSTDSGTTWTLVNIPLNNRLLSGSISPLSVKVDPQDASKIYFVGRAKALAYFASIDGGQTWTETPFVGLNGETTDIDYAGKVLYLRAQPSTGGGGALLYKSTDLGVTWTQIKLPLAPGTDSSFYPNGNNPDLFFADKKVSGTAYFVDPLNQFWKSTDFGATWTMIGSEVTLTNGTRVPQTSVEDMKQDPNNLNTWYIAGNHGNSQPGTCPLTNGGLCGLFKSTDGAKTSTGLNLLIARVTSVALGSPTSTVYAAGDITGLGPTVAKSTNGGDTWTPIQNGLFSSITGRLWADPNDGLLFVGDAISNHDFYVSTDGGANFKASVIPQGPPGCVPGNCQRQNVHDVAFIPTALPNITSVVNGASLQPGIAPNTWVTIFGSNLAGGTDTWNNSIVNGNLPTAVDNVNVTMGGKQAYVYFLSPGQLNVLAPPDLPTGNVDVTVTTSIGTSAPFTATSSQYSPAFFLWPGNQPVATRQNFTFAVKPGTFPGTTTVSAQPGDVLILWGTGFGPTNPAFPGGVAIPSDKTYSTANTPVVTVNSSAVMMFGAALAPGSAGLYQIAIQLPISMADGDYPIQASIGGATSPTGVVLSVKNPGSGK